MSTHCQLGLHQVTCWIYLQQIYLDHVCNRCSTHLESPLNRKVVLFPMETRASLKDLTQHHQHCFHLTASKQTIKILYGQAKEEEQHTT